MDNDVVVPADPTPTAPAIDKNKLKADLLLAVKLGGYGVAGLRWAGVLLKKPVLVTAADALAIVLDYTGQASNNDMVLSVLADVIVAIEGKKLDAETLKKLVLDILLNAKL